MYLVSQNLVVGLILKTVKVAVSTFKFLLFDSSYIFSIFFIFKMQRKILLFCDICPLVIEHKPILY